MVKIRLLRRSKTRIDILYGKGISKEGDVALKWHNNKAGSWYSYGDQRIAGRERQGILMENSDTTKEIIQKIRDKYGLHSGTGVSKDNEAEQEG